MSEESYSLREAAQRLGISKRSLQQCIKDGAFSGLFLAPVHDGLEARIPVEEIEEAIDDLQEKSTRPSPALTQTPSPLEIKSAPFIEAQPLSKLEALPRPLPDAPTQLKPRQDAIAEERPLFLETVTEALLGRDQEFNVLRGQVVQLEQVVLQMQDKLQDLGESPRQLVSPEVADRNLLSAIAGTSRPLSVETKSILDELDTLEALLGLQNGSVEDSEAS